MMRFSKAGKVIVVAATLMMSASVSLSDEAKLSLSNVSVDRRSFDPERGQKVRIRYRLSKPADILVRIHDPDGNMVRMLRRTDFNRQGYDQIAWDGKGENGSFLPCGIYTFTIEAGTGAEEKFVYDGHKITSKPLSLRKVGFDRESGEITYTLPEAALTRIRIGIREGGPLMRTLCSDHPQEAGRHTVNWDGWDNSRVVNLLGNADVIVSVQATSLASNCIILENSQTKLESSEPEFDIQFLDIKEHEENIPIMGSQLTARITLEKRRSPVLLESQFELAFFLDNVFLFEEESGATDPYTFKLDLRNLAPGEHIFTVNIYDLNDYAVASQSRKILTKRNEDS